MSLRMYFSWLSLCHDVGGFLGAGKKIGHIKKIRAAYS